MFNTTDREFLFLRIINGFTLVPHQGITYLVKDPTPYYVYMASVYYQEIYDTLINRGIPTENEVLALLLEKNLWSSEQDKEIEDLLKNTTQLQRGIAKARFQTNEKKRLQAYLDKTRARIEYLYKKKNSLLSSTAEYLAKIESFKQLLFWLTYDMQNNRVWTDWDKFTKSDDGLISNLVNKAFFSDDIDSTKIRALARNDPWRSVWIAANKTGNLFPHPMSEATNYQRLLVTWSLIYDNAYESMDAPSQDIIDNDDLFDIWLEEQNNKRRDNKNGPTISNEKINNSQVIGIVVDTPEDANSVYNLNDVVGKNTIQDREKVIKNHGKISEVHLPDVKRNLQMQINSAFNDRVKEK